MRLRITLLLAIVHSTCSQTVASEPLLRRSIPLPGVNGRIGHLACDAASQRLFVAASANGSLEVVDLSTGQRTVSIQGLKRPRGLLILPDGNSLIVTCAGDGTVRNYDLSTLEEKGARHVGDQPEGILLNDRTGQILVGSGSRALVILQARSLNPVGQVPLKRSPAAFQLDPSGTRVFVNVPGDWLFGGGHVAVADLRSKQVMSTWEFEGAGLNYPLAYDATRQRLYVACRRPARLLVIDANIGRQLGSFECVGDADDLFLNAKSNRLYVIGGAGRVDVFDCGGQECVRQSSIPTFAGARTGLLAVDKHILYVAVPTSLGHVAEIREYLLPD